jgi:hypothetical protein
MRIGNIVALGKIAGDAVRAIETPRNSALNSLELELV